MIVPPTAQTSDHPTIRMPLFRNLLRGDQKAKAESLSGDVAGKTGPGKKRRQTKSSAKRPDQNILDAFPDEDVDTAVPNMPCHSKPVGSTQPVEPVGLPEEALLTSANDLKAKIVKLGMDGADFNFDPIPGSHDINTLVHSLEIALTELMKKTQVSSSDQNVAKHFIKEWAQKTIPFLEKGLSAVEVTPGVEH